MWFRCVIRSRRFQHFLDGIFPRHCIFCRQRLSKCDLLHSLCNDCARQLDLIHKGEFCPHCGTPYEEEPRSELCCAVCEGKDFEFSSVRSLFPHLGPGRALVHELKYRNGWHVLLDVYSLGKILDLELTGKVLVPIPLHWRRFWSRGFNQSELIARELAMAYDIPMLRLLKRVHYTRSQVGLSGEKRALNVAEAFAVDKKVLQKSGISRQQVIVLVDDVFTTGATMNAAACQLKKAGFQRIEVLTLAHR